MKKNRTIRAALMMSAALVLTTPVTAQDAVPVVQVPPPPVTATLPAEPAQSGRSTTPVNPEAAAAAEAEAAELAAERRETRRAAPTRRAAAAAVRTVTPPASTAPAVATPAPQPSTAPSPAPVASEAPVPAPAAPVATEQAATTTTTTTTTTTGDSGAPAWPLVLIAALIVAAGAFFFLRGRRSRDEEEAWAGPEPVHAEPVYAEPTPVAAPIAAAAPVAAAIAPRHDDVAVAPVAAEETSIEHADADDVAALTAGTVADDRPWLEFALRPVRAGTNVDEALVEIELTLGNAGDVAAKDVRISTFMLAAGDDAEMERLLRAPLSEDNVDRLTIAAGEGARVDATLVVNRANLGEGQFRPVVVADARYRLPDGSEGRTSAAFLIGGADAAGPAPIDLGRNLMRDDVEAALYRQPERA